MRGNFPAALQASAVAELRVVADRRAKLTMPLAHPAAAMRGANVVILDEAFVRSLAAVASFGADRLSPAALSKYPGGTETELKWFLHDMALVREALTDAEGCLAGLRKRGFTEAEHFRPLWHWCTDMLSY